MKQKIIIALFFLLIAAAVTAPITSAILSGVTSYEIEQDVKTFNGRTSVQTEVIKKQGHTYKGIYQNTVYNVPIDSVPAVCARETARAEKYLKFYEDLQAGSRPE